MQGATVSPTGELPNLDQAAFQVLDEAKLFPPVRATHPPRILLLYGSLRDRSYSRLVAEEGARLLRAMGAETRFFDPTGLPPLPHTTVKEHFECWRLPLNSPPCTRAHIRLLAPFPARRGGRGVGGESGGCSARIATS